MRSECSCWCCSSATLHLFLKISTGFRLNSEFSEFKILTITYKALLGLVPTCIKDLLDLKNYLRSRDVMTSKKNLLVVPAFNTNSHGRRAFQSVAAPLLWNSISGNHINHHHIREHLTFLKDGWKLLFLHALIYDMILVFYNLTISICNFFNFNFVNRALDPWALYKCLITIIVNDFR